MSPTVRWLAIGLFASVGLNVFVVGAMVGGWARGRHMPPPIAAAPEAVAPSAGEATARGFLQRMMAALPPDQQPGFEAKLQSHRPAIQQAQQELRAARLKLRDRVTAETVDRAGIEAAYAELRTRNAAVQKAIHDAVIDASIDLPAESRRMMVRRVEEPAATMPGRARPPGVPRP